MTQKYIIKDLSQVEGVPCPCGTSQRAITGEDNDVASIHRVSICKDSKKHYHQKLTEFYYVLEGEGEIELDDEVHPLTPGVVVMIPPGVRHRAKGELTILNFIVPPFDPEDEFLD